MTAFTKTEEYRQQRNALRRERYAEDAQYRERIINYERGKRKTDIQDCRRHLQSIAEFGNVREYTKGTDGVVYTGLTFLIDEAAKILDRTPKSLYKYYSKGMFPRPTHYVRGQTGLMQEAYIEDEMRELVAVFGAHLMETPYYSIYHTDTRNALFQCVNS